MEFLMQLKNNEERFGLLTKLLHWAIFLLFVTQYFLVYRREYFPKDSPEKLQYILLHKSLGVIVLGLAVVMLIWAHFGKRPKLPPMSKMFALLARLTHILLYLSMLIMPLTGIMMSQYSGRKVMVFDWFELPRLLAENKSLAGLCHEIHEYSSYVILGVVSVHILGALVHHFFYKDKVLKRMTWGA